MFELPDISSKLKLDLSPLQLGFEKAEGLGKNFASSIGEGFGKLGEVMLSPVALLLETAGAALSVERAFEGVKSAMEGIENVAVAANKIGMSTEAFIGLQYEAKHAHVDMGALEMGINHLRNTLVGAEEDGGKAAHALARLGISSDALINLPVDKQLGMIGDKMKEMSSFTDRAAAASAIFGSRMGFQLVAMLSKGSEGLEEATKRTHLLGTSFDELDAAKVVEANHLMEDMGMIVEGLEQRFAIGLAPYLSAITEKIIDMTTAGGGFGDKVGGAVEYVAKGMAQNVDVIHLFEAAFKTLQSGAAWAMFGIVESLDEVAKAMSWLSEKLGTGKIDTSALDHFADGLAATAKEKFAEAGKAYDDFQNRVTGKEVGRAFDDIRAKSDAAANAIAANAAKMRTGAFSGMEGKVDTEGMKKVEESLDKMKADVATFGMSSGDKQLYDFKNLAGVTDEQIEKYKKLAGQLDKLKENKTIDDEVKKWRDSKDGANQMITKYEELTAKLNKWKDAGKITAEEMAKGMKKAQEELGAGLAKDLSPQVTQFATALKAGSADVSRLQASNGQEDRRRQYEKDALALAKQQADSLTEIASNSDNFAYMDFGD